MNGKGRKGNTCPLLLLPLQVNTAKKFTIRHGKREKINMGGMGMLGIDWAIG